MYKWTVIACLLAQGVIFTGQAWPAPLQRKKSTKSAKKSDPFLEARSPLSFQEVAVAAANVAPERLKQAIENRGVDFESTPKNLAELQKAGATPEILNLIRRVARKPPPAPKPPPPPKKGTLVISCGPPECDISLNGKPQGPTKEGTLSFPLPPGKVVVDFVKDGYMSQQREVAVVSARPVDVSVRLEPDIHTKEKFGAQLLGKTVEMLGASAGLAEAASVIATGKFTLSAPGAQPVEWTVMARLKRPDMTYFEVKSGRNNAWLSLAADDLKSNRKLDKFPQGAELERTIRLFRRFQPAAVIDRIGSQKMQVLANDGLVHTFQAAGAGEAYELSLDPDFVLTGLRAQSPNGAAAGPQVTYSDYVVRGKARYPASIKITLPDGQSAIAFHFDSVTLNAKLANKDFKR